MKKIYFLLLLVSFNISLGLVAQTSTSRGVTNGTPTQQDPTTVKILKSYPNPATAFITFEFQRSYTSGYTIEIYNLPGKRVVLAANISNKITIQLQNFYRGVYIYKLVDRTGRVAESGKFQVTK
jgi:Secretion system C-terminal sorting domain